MALQGADTAFVLHSVPYKETSLIVELFCREHGRVPVVAKGAKRPHSALRSVLLNFQPLAVRFTGKNEVKTLVQAEWCGALMPPEGKALFAAYYLNELLMQGLGREDPHPELFDLYTRALADLSDGLELAVVVRQFELDLLQTLGFGLDFEYDVDGEAVNTDCQYGWIHGRGWVNVHRTRGHLDGETPVVSGHVLHAYHTHGMSKECALALKPVTRLILMNELSPKGLCSRAWMEQLLNHD